MYILDTSVKTIDGVVASGFTSWALFRAEGIQAETIVWETQSDLDLTATTPILFSLHQQETITAREHHLGRFRLSYTTDSQTDHTFGLARSGEVSAHWVVITPLTASGSHSDTFATLGDSSVLVSGSPCCHPVYSKKQDLGACEPFFVRRLAPSPACGRAGVRVRARHRRPARTRPVLASIHDRLVYLFCRRTASRPRERRLDVRGHARAGL